MKRPLSVTVVALLLMFMGLSRAYATLRYFNDPSVQQAFAGNPLSPSVQLVWSIIGIAVLVGSGALMLKGVNEARITYLVYAPVAMLLNAALFGVSVAGLFSL